MKKNKPEKKSKAAAIKYTGTGAPLVIAKGEGAIAAKIEQVAQQNDIPLIQDATLTSLLSQVPLGDEIPENLYLAVAEVLAHIYRVSGMIDSYQ